MRVWLSHIRPNIQKIAKSHQAQVSHKHTLIYNECLENKCLFQISLLIQRERIILEEVVWQSGKRFCENKNFFPHMHTYTHIYIYLPTISLIYSIDISYCHIFVYTSLRTPFHIEGAWSDFMLSRKQFISTNWNTNGEKTQELVLDLFHREFSSLLNFLFDQS